MSRHVELLEGMWNMSVLYGTRRDEEQSLASGTAILSTIQSSFLRLELPQTNAARLTRTGGTCEIPKSRFITSWSQSLANDARVHDALLHGQFPPHTDPRRTPNFCHRTKKVRAEARVDTGTGLGTGSLALAFEQSAHASGIGGGGPGAGFGRGPGLNGARRGRGVEGGGSQDGDRGAAGASREVVRAALEKMLNPPEWPPSFQEAGAAYTFDGASG